MKWQIIVTAGVRSFAHLLLTTIIVLFMCLPLFSQGSAGRIIGTITDQSGGAIAGANVTVTDVQRNIARNLTTDDTGDYNAPNLIPGAYTVRVGATGFSSVERQNIVLEVGQDEHCPAVGLRREAGLFVCGARPSGGQAAVL